MLRHDYWMFEFISISRKLVEAPGRYARAFLHTETDGTTSPTSSFTRSK